MDFQGQTRLERRDDFTRVGGQERMQIKHIYLFYHVLNSAV